MATTNLFKQGEKVSRNSAIVSFFLLIIKLIVGFFSGSIVLVSDALDSGFDLLTMIASWVGFKISRRKPTKKFQYGYYKIESIISLFISLLILFTAYNLIILGYSRLFTASLIKLPVLSVIVSFLSLITSFLLSKYLNERGKKLNSQLLISNSKERLTDCVKSGIVLFTILTSYYGVPYIEGSVTIIISILIFKIGSSLIKDAIFTLMDVSPSKDIELKISRIIKKIKGVESFNNLKLRKSGPFIFGEVIIKVRRFINIKKAHEISNRIEEEIKKKISRIEYFIIHVEPFINANQKILISLKENKGLNSEVVSHFGKADNFIFINIEDKKIKSYYVKKNIHKKRKIRAGVHAVDLITKEGINVLITKELGQISFHTLRDKLVDIYKAKGLRVKDVINNYLNNKLRRLTKPTRKKD